VKASLGDIIIIRRNSIRRSAPLSNAVNGAGRFMAIRNAAIDRASEDCGTLFGHPKGLYVLFLTETWERFSFYGLRALLIFYLTQRFHFTDNKAFAIYGNYSALVYIYPLLGGLLADRYFGYRKSVMYGAILMIVGHAGLVLQEEYFSAGASSYELLNGSNRNRISSGLFYLSLAFVIAGVGFLKSNISTMVGKLYPRESQLRDSGFTIFNWGINIGATLAAFTCGYVGQKYGWAYGFGLAGSGMVLGLTIFLAGQNYLIGGGRPATAEPDKVIAELGMKKAAIVAVFVVFSILLTWQLIQLVDVFGYIVTGTVLLALSRTVYIGFIYLNQIERERLWCALIIWGIWTSYAALIEQAGSSINLFTERVVNRRIHFPHIPWLMESITPLSGHGIWTDGIEIQSAQLLGVTAFLLLVLSPVFAWLWGYLEKRHLNPSTPAKLCISLFSMAAGYGVIVLGTMWSDATGHINLIWLILLYLFFAIAALIVGPIGLSAITRLAASRIVGFLVGLWMLGVAAGTYVAAKVARFSSLDPTAMATTRSSDILAHYKIFFCSLAFAALILGVVFSFLTPVMRKWMHGLH
jgi:proton-dependent oligopeptide transporter, POT family